MLGDVCLLHPELFHKFPGRQFAVLQQFNNGDSRRVRKRLEDVCLETAQVNQAYA